MARKKKVTDESAILADTIIEAIQEVKGKEIVLLDLTKIPDAVCNYFIICSGESTTQVSAIADSIDKEVKKKLKEDAWHKEGFENSEWILLDYITVVVHIFQPETRTFYNLERLWADAEIKIIK